MTKKRNVLLTSIRYSQQGKDTLYRHALSLTKTAHLYISEKNKEDNLSAVIPKFSLDSLDKVNTHHISRLSDGDHQCSVLGRNVLQNQNSNAQIDLLRIRILLSRRIISIQYVSCSRFTTNFHYILSVSFCNLWYL